MKHFVYVLTCADNTLYCGYTTDIERRVDEHNGVGKKSGAKYTAPRRPVKLAWSRAFPTRSAAAKEEARIKQLTRKEKEVLIASDT